MVKQTGLSDADWRGMFPSAHIVHDRVLMPQAPLKGRLKTLAEIITRRVGSGDTELANPDLYGELGMDRRDFGKLVKKPEWQAWIAALGLKPELLKGRVMGLRRVA